MYKRQAYDSELQKLLDEDSKVKVSVGEGRLAVSYTHLDVYKRQSQEFSTEALNAHQRTLRMRGRPKIVLARTYNEAIGIYEFIKIGQDRGRCV